MPIRSLRLLAPDAFGSNLSKLAERFAVAFRRHTCEAAQGGNKLPKLSWTAAERAHFNQLVSDRKPTSRSDWQSIADALGTGRSGEALRMQLHAKRQGAAHAAPEQAHAPSCLLSIAASSAAASPQSEAPSPAPLCVPLRVAPPAQSDAAAFSAPHPMELELQSAA